MTIGVVALDTAAPHFDFVVQDARKTGRILAMFPKAGKALYREARAKLELELESIRKAVNGQGAGAEVPVFPAFREKEDGLLPPSPARARACFAFLSKVAGWRPT